MTYSSRFNLASNPLIGQSVFSLFHEVKHVVACGMSKIVKYLHLSGVQIPYWMLQ